jgi:hypothetical protein
MDEDARAAAVLTSSVLPQFASEFMGLPTVADMWAHLRQCYQPFGDALYLFVVHQECNTPTFVTLFKQSLVMKK